MVIVMTCVRGCTVCQDATVNTTDAAASASAAVLGDTAMLAVAAQIFLQKGAPLRPRGYGAVVAVEASPFGKVVGQIKGRGRRRGVSAIANAPFSRRSAPLPPLLSPLASSALHFQRSESRRSVAVTYYFVAYS